MDGALIPLTEWGRDHLASLIRVVMIVTVDGIALRGTAYEMAFTEKC